MADDIALPGTGAVVATNERDGKHFQEVDIAGEMIEATQALRIAVHALKRAATIPDPSGRVRILLDAISASLTLATITTVGTVTTVTSMTTLATLTNQSQIGGLIATPQIPALMAMGAATLRRNIAVT